MKYYKWLLWLALAVHSNLGAANTNLLGSHLHHGNRFSSFVVETHIKGHFITSQLKLKTILKDNDRKVKKTISHCESNLEFFPLAASPLTTELWSPNNHQPSQPFMYMAQVYASATHLAVRGWLENPPQQERSHASIYLPHNIKLCEVLEEEKVALFPAFSPPVFDLLQQSQTGGGKA